MAEIKFIMLQHNLCYTAHASVALQLGTSRRDWGLLSLFRSFASDCFISSLQGYRKQDGRGHTAITIVPLAAYSQQPRSLCLLPHPRLGRPRFHFNGHPQTIPVPHYRLSPPCMGMDSPTTATSTRVTSRTSRRSRRSSGSEKGHDGSESKGSQSRRDSAIHLESQWCVLAALLAPKRPANADSPPSLDQAIISLSRLVPRLLHHQHLPYLPKTSLYISSHCIAARLPSHRSSSPPRPLLPPQPRPNLQQSPTSPGSLYLTQSIPFYHPAQQPSSPLSPLSRLYRLLLPRRPQLRGLLVLLGEDR